VYQHAGDAGFGLATQTEQQNIVTAEHSPFHIWDHGIIKAINARKDVFLTFNLFDEVGTKLIFYRAGLVARLFEVTERADFFEIFHCWEKRGSASFV